MVIQMVIFFQHFYSVFGSSLYTCDEIDRFFFRFYGYHNWPIGFRLGNHFHAESNSKFIHQSQSVMCIVVVVVSPVQNKQYSAEGYLAHILCAFVNGNIEFRKNHRTVIHT